jgi:hypothetical protein
MSMKPAGVIHESRGVGAPDKTGHFRASARKEGNTFGPTRSAAAEAKREAVENAARAW